MWRLCIRETKKGQPFTFSPFVSSILQNLAMFLEGKEGTMNILGVCVCICVYMLAHMCA